MTTKKPARSKTAKAKTKPKAAPTVIAKTVSFEEAIEDKRPYVTYSEELADTICGLIATGVSMTDICGREGLPSYMTIYNWKRRYSEFAAKLEDARLFRAEARADRIDDIIQEIRDGKLDANAARVIIDAEKWQAGKENKRYADRLSAELTGANGKDLIPEADNKQLARALLDASPEIIEVLIGMRALAIPNKPSATVDSYPDTERTAQESESEPERIYRFDPRTGKLVEADGQN